MGQHIFKKPEPPHVRGICAACGKNPQKSSGGGRYKAVCSACNKRLRESAARRALHDRRKPWRRHVGPVCEKCGFVPEHVCQLDVDHRDGDRANRAPENLQTLCANCHRLKTWICKDNHNKKKAPA